MLQANKYNSSPNTHSINKTATVTNRQQRGPIQKKKKKEAQSWIITMVSRRTVSGAEMQIKRRVERKWGSIQLLVWATLTGRHPPQMSIMEKNRKCLFLYHISSLVMMYCVTALQALSWVNFHLHPPLYPPPPNRFCQVNDLNRFIQFLRFPASAVWKPDSILQS